VLLQGVLRQVVDLLGLIVVVIDVLIITIYARHTLAMADAAEHQGAVLGQLMEQRIARVLAVLYLITQHLQHGGQNVGVVRKTLDPLAVLEPPRGVNDERYLQSLLPDGVAVHEAAVLAEAFSMVAEEDEDRLVIEP
jgi:hypothetical protein